MLLRFGAIVSCDNDSVSVSPGTLRGIQIDAKNIPDLVPILACVASVAEGKTVITGAGRLRTKESDRLQSVTRMLQNLGADIKETDSGLVITGRKTLGGGSVSSAGDHRIAMAASVISSVCDGDVLILDADVTDKSYPGFFHDFAALGGSFEEEN